jgi:signal peptidase I
MSTAVQEKQKRSKAGEKKVPRWKNELREWAKSLFYGIIFVYFFTTFGFKAYKVEGSSMQPLLQDGERIFVNRYIYLADELPLLKLRLPFTRLPERGDVVVFWFPKDPSKYFIKRVIGIPGDVVSVRNGTIYVNGRKVNVSPIASRYLDHKTRPQVSVPQGYYYCVGDHHARSYDSRDWGFVPRKYIIGKAVFRYWPLTKIGLIRYEGDPPFFVGGE